MRRLGLLGGCSEATGLDSRRFRGLEIRAAWWLTLFVAFAASGEKRQSILVFEGSRAAADRALLDMENLR